MRIILERYNTEVMLTLPGTLTFTELSILRMLMQGMSITEISRRRGRSGKTISCQKASLYRKLGIKNDITMWLDLLLRYSGGALGKGNILIIPAWE